MNTAVITQCKELYETSGLSVSDIAVELDLEPEAVKTILIQNSQIFNKNLALDKETFTDVDYEAAKEAMKSCLYSEESAVVFRASQFIINEKKGRNDPVKSIKTAGNFNVLIINNQMKRAKEAIAKSKNKRVIDVTSTSEEQAA